MERGSWFISAQKVYSILGKLAILMTTKEQEGQGGRVRWLTGKPRGGTMDGAGGVGGMVELVIFIHVHRSLHARPPASRNR